MPPPENVPTPAEDHGVIRYNAKLGLVFFVIYLLIYATFVGLCTFQLVAMSKPWLGGVNVAVWYGFGLIGSAFVLAVLYLNLCKN